MDILYGKPVCEKIEQTFNDRIKNLKVKPNIAILGMNGNDASEVYIKRIEKNCKKYRIGFNLKMAETEEQFISNFNQVKKDESITGVMFQQPLSKKISDLINELPSSKDIEGVGINNMGRLFIGKEDVLTPCTSKAVIETLNYYKIELTGKKVVIAGRSNIVGKPLIPQLLQKDATVTICHSKTKNIKEEFKQADIIIMAIGKAKFLKDEDIKKGAILIDVGINFEDGKIVGDIDFESIKEKAEACTPVPGGIGGITNSLLIDNIIKSCEINFY